VVIDLKTRRFAVVQVSELATWDWNYRVTDVGDWEGTKDGKLNSSMGIG